MKMQERWMDSLLLVQRYWMVLSAIMRHVFNAAVVKADSPLNRLSSFQHIMKTFSPSMFLIVELMLITLWMAKAFVVVSSWQHLLWFLLANWEITSSEGVKMGLWDSSFKLLILFLSSGNWRNLILDQSTYLDRCWIDGCYLAKLMWHWSSLRYGRKLCCLMFEGLYDMFEQI